MATETDKPKTGIAHIYVFDFDFVFGNLAPHQMSPAFHKKRILLQLLLHVFVREAKKEEEKRQLKSTIQNKKSDVVASLPRM